MRIVFCTYQFGEYSIRQASAMARDHDVLLIISREQWTPHRGLVDPAVELCVVDPPRLRQPLRQAFSVRSIHRAIDRFAPDVVHFQQGHLWFNLALPFLRRYPLVMTIHDPRHHVGDRASRKTPQAVMDFGFRRADRVIVHGQRLIGPVVEEIGIPAERIHVIPHVALGTRPPGDAPAERNNVLFFGRLWAYKGLDELIRAEPEITRRIPDVKIVVAGEGEDFEKYRRLMVHPERFDVHNRWIDDAERAGFFQRAAVVVLPYIEATQSGVVPVAYTFGRPVVATRVGALADCIDDGVTGLLVPPRDDVALAGAIARLLTDDDLRRRMGAAGRDKVEREWSPEEVGRQNVEVYRAAIADHRGRRAPRRQPEEKIHARA